MHMRNSLPNSVNITASHQQHPRPSQSAEFPNTRCDSCHSLEFEVCNVHHSPGQFNMSAVTRTSNNATNESPDYVAFHGQNQETHVTQTCNKCYSEGDHLRNSLIRDMRNHYGTTQWQHQSNDMSHCYAYKDCVPYAPFALEPTNSVQRTVSGCTRCKELCSDSFRNVQARNEWNPYPMNDRSYQVIKCNLLYSRPFRINGKPIGTRIV